MKILSQIWEKFEWWCLRNSKHWPMSEFFKGDFNHYRQRKDKMIYAFLCVGGYKCGVDLILINIFIREDYICFTFIVKGLKKKRPKPAEMIEKIRKMGIKGDMYGTVNEKREWVFTLPVETRDEIIKDILSSEKRYGKVGAE